MPTPRFQGKEKEKELLDRLKEFFVEKGGPARALAAGWQPSAVSSLGANCWPWQPTGAP